MIEKEKFKLVWQSLHPFAMHVLYTNYNSFNLKKEPTILIPAKQTNVRKKSFHCLPENFSKAFLNDFPFKMFLLEMEKSISLV